MTKTIGPVQRAAIKALIDAAPAHKKIGPHMTLYARRNGEIMTWIDDELLKALPSWAIAARPLEVREDESMRHYWCSPIDRVLLVALHDYVSQWLYKRTWDAIVDQTQFATFEDYCKHMLKKAEWDLQDHASRVFAAYCNYKVFGE